jgi:hypothetical protein
VRGVLIQASALLVALVLAVPAWADDPPPPPQDSAIDQYVEGVPGAAGPAVPGVAPRTARNPLSSRARSSLSRSGGTDAPLLHRLATSPALGAPPARSQQKPVPRIARPRDESPSPVGVVPAAVTAVSDGGGTRFVVLGLALLAISAATLGASARRIRRRPV